jgi:hypothetical protein
MNPFVRFERLCARVVEGTFARIFPSALEPAHVGRKLLAARALTPTDTYLVRVHPVDYARFAGDRLFLEARWSALLRETAAEGETPHAVLHEDPDIVAGSVTIEPIFDERPSALRLAHPDGTDIPLREGLTIGRQDDNDVVLRDARVSRRHARIVAHGSSGFAIEDVGSTNGTFVDGKAVRRAVLHAGTSIGIGETLLEIRG